MKPGPWRFRKKVERDVAQSLLFLLTCSTAAIALSAPVLADDTPQPVGNIDLIDMPDARMAPDGELAFDAQYFLNNQSYTFNFQALPWLDTKFVYSGLEHFDAAFPVYWDRSFEIKARLFNETKFLPAIAVGLNDLIGTQVYSSEYLVASKQYGEFDATFGIGWGTLGTAGRIRNPLTLISSSFANRVGYTSAGGFSINTFFHGKTSGLFGGIKWHTPIDGLDLITEYSSDAYSLQKSRGNFDPRSQLNYGASYQVFDNTTLSLAWFYGRSIEGDISFQLDPSHDSYPQKIGPSPPEAHIRTPQEQQQALNLLLQQRNSLNAQQSQASVERRSFLANGALVDALWQVNDGMNDFTIQGRTLSLAISHGDLKTICEKSAQLVGRYRINIETVSVSDGREKQRCVVTSSPILVLQDGDLSFEPGPTMLTDIAVRSGDLLTIDATAQQPPDFRLAINNIRADAIKQKLIIQAINLTDTEALIYYSNTTYPSEKNALNRLIRVLMADAPPSIDKFRLINTLGGEPQREFEVLRAPAERSVAQSGNLNFDDDITATPAPMQNPVLTASERGTYPRYSWLLFPQFRQELFDPSNPLGVQLLAAAQGTVELLPGFSLASELEANIWDDFNTARPADSLLPHVRTEWLRYFTKGKNGIGDLESDYSFRLAPDIYALIRAGYLESMFAGVGGEVLWQPEGERWALGGDLYDVKQRDFNRMFGLQPYHVVTGHVSLYYASPWYGLNFAVRAGQYLAGDKGVTVEATRRFSTGVELGVFFTKTNVSAAQFGEGSFDKGFTIRIPLGWTLPINSQGEFSTVIRPVQRDGGQRLDGDANLYEDIRRASEGELALDSDQPF